MLYQGLQSLGALLKIHKVRIDNVIFQLHYQVTCTILFAFSILVTAKQYFGDPIDCQFQSSPLRNDFVDSYCWVYSTYTVRPSHGKQAAQNISPNQAGNQKDDSQLLYHKYYQWVSVVLFLQALLFFAPRYLWSVRENGRLKKLVSGLDTLITEESSKSSKVQMLSDYFMLNWRAHDVYAYGFFLCELLNFVNVVTQIFLTDAFLGFEFISYISRAFDVAVHASDNAFDYSDVIFPKLTKCDLSGGGFGFGREKYSGLCVLPLNIVNEKIYAFLGLWFIILSVITGLGLVYRATVIFAPKARVFLLRSRARAAETHYVDVVAEHSQIGDWFILYQVGRNVEPAVFRELLQKLAVRLGEDSHKLRSKMQGQDYI